MAYPAFRSLLISSMMRAMSKPVMAPASIPCRLHDNIQFIYELRLACLELEAAGARVEVGEDYRQVIARGLVDPGAFARRSAYFADVGGRRSRYADIQKASVTRSINQYLTHWFYPYKGKFHPQMIRALANILKVPEGGKVLDPFVGSGTTALECQLLGIDGVGLDISPLCVAVSSAKVHSLGVLEDLRRLAGSPEGEEKGLFAGAADPARGNAAVRTFYQVADLIAASDALRRRRDRDKAREGNLRRMLASVEAYAGIRDRLDLALGRWEIREGDALELPFESWTFDAVITSPPYSIALDYMANDAAALETLGAEADLLRGRCLGLKGARPERVARYHQDLARAVREIARVLKPGGGLVLVLGDASVDAEVLPTTRLASEAAVAAGLKPGPAVDKVIFGLYSVMQREKILLFSKPP